MESITMKVLPGSYCVHRLPPTGTIPDAVYRETFFNITQTDKELSIVCDSQVEIDSEKSEDGFSCMQVVGVLDFSLTGILADITSSLSTAGISTFALSTYNTDYILFKSVKLELARKSLQEFGYQILE